ncbi:hypothetical protein, partial [Clostridium sp.]|uniref:hypothetical protein n=1 Tax=Clostridium sp. TaxID=1506 RepID=UPI002FCAC56F
MAVGKLLFPPIVPNSLPAFDKTKVLRYYFKPSSQNTMTQIKHLQMTIVRFDTNRTILNKNTYPFGIIFKKRNEIFEDTAKGYFYVDIPASLFPLSDSAYKIQIRVGEEDITQHNTNEKLGTWLKNPNTLNKLSEWSIVTYAMPITIPSFGIQGFSTTERNNVFSTGYVFTGFYEPKDQLKKEVLSSYVYNLYTFVNKGDKNTWKLVESSGPKFAGIGNELNMEYSFSRELIEETSYIVTLSVQTKNLYTSTHQYEVHSTTYPVIELFNSIDINPNSEDASMDITIRAKQLLLKPTPGTTVEYVRDEPNVESYPNIKGTHAIIKGSVEEDRNLLLTAIDGKWVCQAKVMFSNIYENLRELYANPMILIEDDMTNLSESDYFSRIKIGAMRINLAYPITGNLNPSPIWEYRIIIRKEILSKNNSQEVVIASQ